MRKVATVLFWLLALVVLMRCDAFAQVHEQPYTVGVPPEARHRTCVGTAAACVSLGFQIENHEQHVVVGGQDGGENVQSDVIQQSEIPNDNRAVACHNALAMGGVMQACAYGLNYPGNVSGVPLAGRAKFVGYNGVVFGTYSGPMDVIADGSHVARFWDKGFGFGGYNYVAHNAFTLGWGQCTTAPSFGEVTMCAMPGLGGIYHLYVVTSDGGARCLSCAP
jgi:hypothetical protein